MNDNIKDPVQDIVFSDPELNEQLKKLVLERVGAMPDSLGISIGSNELTKNDALEHVEKGDDVGKQIIEMELEFIRGLASGAVYSYE